MGSNTGRIFVKEIGRYGKCGSRKREEKRKPEKRKKEKWERSSQGLATAGSQSKAVVMLQMRALLVTVLCSGLTAEVDNAWLA